MGGDSKGGGGGGGSIKLTPSPLEQMQSQIARQIFLESTPLRTGLLASIEDIFGLPRTIQPSTGEFVSAGTKEHPFKKFVLHPSGDMQVNPFGVYGQARQDLENQYPVARENILSTNPSRGGQLNNQLFNLDVARAGEVGGLRERVINNALGLASGVAFQTPATVLGARDNSAQRQAIAAQLQAANAGAGASKKGSGLGALGQLGGAAIGRLPQLSK